MGAKKGEQRCVVCSNTVDKAKLLIKVGGLNLICNECAETVIETIAAQAEGYGEVILWLDKGKVDSLERTPLRSVFL